MSGREHFSQSASRVMSLGPIDSQGLQEIGHVAIRGTLRTKVDGSREKGCLFDFQNGIDPAECFDLDSQLCGELRAIKAQFLGGRVTSLPTKLIPPDEQIEQPSFNRGRRHSYT